MLCPGGPLTAAASETRNSGWSCLVLAGAQAVLVDRLAAHLGGCRMTPRQWSAPTRRSHLCHRTRQTRPAGPCKHLRGHQRGACTLLWTSWWRSCCAIPGVDSVVAAAGLQHSQASDPAQPAPARPHHAGEEGCRLLQMRRQEAAVQSQTTTSVRHSRAAQAPSIQRSSAAGAHSREIARFPG